MYDKVKQYVEEHNMLKKSDHIIAGISGGADSICLLCMLIQLKELYQLRITVVHVNHGLRGADADADAAYVESFCTGRGIPIEIYRFDVREMAKEQGVSLEEAGRYARRQAFEEVAAGVENGKIALAHHMDDSVETLLLNLARGTGLRGAGGILPVNGRYIRPLLCVTRGEIEAYLGKNHVKYCIDETNYHDTYTRNRIRNHVVPYMKKEVNQGFERHAMEFMDQMQQLYDYVETQVSIYEKQCIENINGEVLIKDLFQDIPQAIKPYLIQNVLKCVSGMEQDTMAAHIKAVEQLFGKQVGKHIDLPYSMEATREYQGIRVAVKKEEKKQKVGQEASLHCKVFEYNGKTGDFPQNIYTKWFDYDIIRSGLIARNRQTNDRIVIDDAGNTQKITRYFINEKIPSDIRDDIWLIADGDDILWIVGYRQSKKYQVSENTKRVLEIRIDGGTPDGRINQSLTIQRTGDTES